MKKQILSEEEKKQIMVEKAKEIRDEFFHTYTQLKDLPAKEKSKLMKKVPWNEHMTVTSEKKIIIDPTLLNGEIQREVQYYEITMDNVQRAIAYLTQEGIPLQKPEDYDVEMFKAPQQMNRIVKRVERKEGEVKAVQEQKMKKQSKRLSKIMKSKQMRDEHKYKKQNHQAIEEWKKEIRQKGSENARDLNEFIKKNTPTIKKQKQNKKDKKAEGIKKKGITKVKKAFNKVGKGKKVLYKKQSNKNRR